MSKEDLTRCKCDWCGDEVELPQKRRLFFGVSSVPYPDSWCNIKLTGNDMICGKCYGKVKNSVTALKQDIMKNSKSKKSVTK